MELNIRVATNDVQMILGALAKLPLEQSLETFFKVKNQAEAQIAMQQAAEAEKAGGTD